jgi:TonB family protein
VQYLSSRLGLGVLILAGGCVNSRVAPEQPVPVPLPAPPLPAELRDGGQKLLDYYPDASRRAHEQGRVVVKLQIDASGARSHVIEVDHERTHAASRLEDAAVKILKGAQFETGDTYRKDVTASILFELEPCGAVTHDPTADYRIALCLDPNPFAYFDFAKTPPTALEEQIHAILFMAT